MTAHTLRPYQVALHDGIRAQWAAGHRNVLAVAPTGSGKTVLFSHMLTEEPGASVAIAHRQELVTQMSLAVAREGVRHRVIGPDSVQRACAGLHMQELGVNYVNPAAACAVAGVDTLVRRDGGDPWFNQVRLWITDESHHMLGGASINKWGKAVGMFPNARGLGVTATPVRADGKGLGRHADGLIDAMVVGPSMRELILQGYLTDYKIYAPPSDLDLSGVTLSEGGDYSPPKLRAAVHKSRIVGDVVASYLKIAPGKLGITFAVDIESATELCGAYRAAGVPAEVVTSKTPDSLRLSILRRFRAREVLQLCNVGLFDEGFDLPAIEVVSMARPTQSYGLYCQQFGRALRLLDGKLWAIIIDHVGNVIRHGLPDAPRVWSLDRRERRSTGGPTDVVPVRSCPKCTAVYERIHRTCPYCGHYAEPAGRGSPELVDGDLQELTADALARMRGEVARVDGPPALPVHLGEIVVRAAMGRHHELQRAQAGLRQAMALWGGWRTAAGEDVATAQRRWFHWAGVDVLSAQALRAREALELTERINDALRREGVVNG